MRYGVSSLDRNLAYAKLIDMSSTQKLTTAGIRYRLFIAQKSLRWLAAKLGWDVSKLSRRLAGQPAFKVDARINGNEKEVRPSSEEPANLSALPHHQKEARHELV